MLSVDTGAIIVEILPTRGMSIWKAWMGETHVGWQSPVRGPVHPALVPVSDASGIGWLEGFDELLVRCGLTSNGAPEFSPNGTVRWPLHGRVANLPATELWVEVNEAHGYVDVIGVVPETRFLIGNLQLTARYRFRPGSAKVEVFDEVKNCSDLPATMQLLYHINVGSPILSEGSEIIVDASRVSARDARAAEGLAEWQKCLGPTVGYAEQVYFLKTKPGDNNRSEAALVNFKTNLGFSVEFETTTLPYLTVWKNTASEQDGYVVGLEPATGFPNIRSVEEEQGRLVAIEAGETKSFFVSIEPIKGRDQLLDIVARIRRT